MKCLTDSMKITLLVVLIVTSKAHAESWDCSHTDLVREVVIEYPEGGAVPCNVVYKKGMEGFEDQVLWSALNEEGYCEQKAHEFIVKLESWGWDCVEAVSSNFAKTEEDSESNAPSEHDVDPKAAPLSAVAPGQGVSSGAVAGSETEPEQSFDLPQVDSVDTNTPVADKIP